MAPRAGTHMQEANGQTVDSKPWPCVASVFECPATGLAYVSMDMRSPWRPLALLAKPKLPLNYLCIEIKKTTDDEAFWLYIRNRMTEKIAEKLKEKG